MSEAGAQVRGMMVGWNPADELPVLVLVCPYCGRKTRAIAGIARTVCECGAILRQLFYAMERKAAPSREEIQQ